MDEGEVMCLSLTPVDLPTEKVCEYFAGRRGHVKESETRKYLANCDGDDVR